MSKKFNPEDRETHCNCEHVKYLQEQLQKKRERRVFVTYHRGHDGAYHICGIFEEHELPRLRAFVGSSTRHIVYTCEWASGPLSPRHQMTRYYLTPEETPDVPRSTESL